MLVAENLTRKYGDFTAVADVSFAINKGEIVGLLGHNGAGKTTVMKMLTGYLEPTEGRVLIDGADIETDLERAQSRIGYLPENCPVYQEMTVLDYLDYAAELRGVEADRRDSAIRRAIEATDLFQKADAPISALSRGLRQRVGVAQAILHAPEIVILDEPTNGLDPSQIKQMRTLIKSLATDAAVILSTHILQEVQAVCDRAIIINRGRVACDAKLKELQGGARLRIVSSLAPEELRGALAEYDRARIENVSSDRDAHAFELAIEDADPDPIAARTARLIVEKGGDLIALHPVARDLDALFAEISSGDPQMAEAARV